VEQELPTLTEHLSSPPVFSEIRVTQSLIFCVMFVDRCLSFCHFSCGHCVVCPPSNYGFGLSPLVSTNVSEYRHVYSITMWIAASLAGFMYYQYTKDAIYESGCANPSGRNVHVIVAREFVLWKPLFILLCSFGFYCCCFCIRMKIPRGNHKP